MPSNAAADAKALAKLKWEQNKGQLYLFVVLCAATAAVFYEAIKNGAIKNGLQIALDDGTSSDDMDDPEAMSCTDPRPDPLTDSTAHFGDCCSVYGVTPKPLWVLLLQALLAALIFDLGGHMWTGKATLFRFADMNKFSYAYIVLQGIVAMVSTYSILAKYNYAGNKWDNYSHLLLVWLNSSAGPAAATALVLATREFGANAAEAKKVLIQEIGAVKYAALDDDEQFERIHEVVDRLEAERGDGFEGENSNLLKSAFCVSSINLCLTGFFVPVAITHFFPALVIYLPMALFSTLAVILLPDYLYGEPIFPADPEKPHTVLKRLVYVPARALVSSWQFCGAMIGVVLAPTWMAIFYTNTSWTGALVQDWESRDTGRFFACLKIQFQSVTGGADAVGLIF